MYVKVIKYTVLPLLRDYLLKVYLFVLGLVLLAVAPTVLSTWRINSLPAVIPYLLLLFINKVQIVALVFATSQTFLEDLSKNSVDALFTRPLSNVGYVLSRSIGVVMPFLIIDLILMAALFIVHAAFLDADIIPITYLYYPLILVLPAMIFTIGATVLLTVVIRNEVVTYAGILVMLIVMGSGLGTEFPQIGDFSGGSLPMLYSEFIGFGNMQVILLQRMLYVLSGTGFMLLAGLLFSRTRLPQSPRVTLATGCIVALLFFGAWYSAREYLAYRFAGGELRFEMRALEESTPACPVSCASCSLDLIHDGNEIEVAATVAIRNTSAEPLNACCFRLNPGLVVQSVSQGVNQLTFDRQLHLLNVSLPAPLASGAVDSLTVTYRGTIVDNACYIDIDEAQHEKWNSKFLMTIDKRYSFIRPDFVLLTSENQWYPTPFVPYRYHGLDVPKREFTNYRLKVATDRSLTAISQGESNETEPGQYVFTPDSPLTQLSLVIGSFRKISTTVDGITYSAYMKSDHDYTKGLELLTQEDVAQAIREEKTEYESQLRLSYPFNRLSIIEVPLQYLAYRRINSFTPATVQPEQVLVPERGYCGFALSSDISTLTPWKEREYDCLKSYFGRLTRFSPGLSYAALDERFGLSQGKLNIWSYSYTAFNYDYGVYPNYYPYSIDTYSDTYQFCDLFLQYLIQVQTNHVLTSNAPHNLSLKNILSFGDIVRKLSSRYTIEELFTRPEYSYIMYNVLGRKADAIYDILLSRSGLDRNSAGAVIEAFVDRHRFTSAPVDSLFNTLGSQAGMDFMEYTDRWLNDTGLPKFEVLNATRTDIVKNNRAQSYYHFVIHNSGDANGVFGMSIPSGDDGVHTTVYLEKNQAKEIGLCCSVGSYFFVQAGASNAYSERTVQFTPKEIPAHSGIELFEGERIVDVPVQVASQDTIIIDNCDDGFQLEQPELLFFKKLLGVTDTVMLEQSGFNERNPSSRWREGCANFFYGRLEENAFYISDGKGNATAQWTADLPETGTYDVYYYTPSREHMRILDPEKDIFAVDDFHFTIDCGNKQEEVTMDALVEDTGWTQLGTFDFPEKKAIIRLSNKTKGDLVYADAVKLVRRESN